VRVIARQRQHEACGWYLPLSGLLPLLLLAQLYWDNGNMKRAVLIYAFTLCPSRKTISPSEKCVRARSRLLSYEAYEKLKRTHKDTILSWYIYIYTYSLSPVFTTVTHPSLLVNFSGVVLSHLRLIVPTQRAILVPKVRYFSTSCVASTNARTEIEELGPSCILSLAVKQRRINKFEGEGVKKKGKKNPSDLNSHTALSCLIWEKHASCMYE
jgi:hypothetical protein